MVQSGNANTIIISENELVIYLVIELVIFAHYCEFLQWCLTVCSLFWSLRRKPILSALAEIAPDNLENYVLELAMCVV
jgi:hypothetical protein